jgi:hypothetical protein
MWHAYSREEDIQNLLRKPEQEEPLGGLGTIM